MKATQQLDNLFFSSKKHHDLPGHYESLVRPSDHINDTTGCLLISGEFLCLHVTEAAPGSDFWRNSEFIIEFGSLASGWVNKCKVETSGWKVEGEKRREGENVPLLLPPTDTDWVTTETFSPLNLISLSTLSFSSRSLSFNHLQVPPPSVDSNCYSSRDGKKERKRQGGGEVQRKGDVTEAEDERKKKKSRQVTKCYKAILNLFFFLFFHVVILLFSFHRLSCELVDRSTKFPHSLAATLFTLGGWNLALRSSLAQDWAARLVMSQRAAD